MVGEERSEISGVLAQEVPSTSRTRSNDRRKRIRCPASTINKVLTKNRVSHDSQSAPNNVLARLYCCERVPANAPPHLCCSQKQRIRSLAPHKWSLFVGHRLQPGAPQQESASHSFRPQRPDDHLVPPSSNLSGITTSVLVQVDSDEDKDTFMQDDIGQERLARAAIKLLQCHVDGEFVVHSWKMCLCSNSATVWAHWLMNCTERSPLRRRGELHSCFAGVDAHHRFVPVRTVSVLS